MGKTNETWRPRKWPVQRRSRETVGYILEAAAQVFGNLGYERTTTNHVAEKAGVSIGSVYQYFPNKEALLLALAESHLTEAREKATAALRRLRESGASEEEFFRGFVEFVVGFHRGGEPLHDLFFDEAPSSGRIVELVADLHAGSAAEIEAYLRGRGLDGEDLPLKSAMLARIAGELTHGMLLYPPAGHDSTDLQEEVVVICLAYLDSYSGGKVAARPG